jgi:hypothetical protein
VVPVEQVGRIVERQVRGKDDRFDRHQVANRGRRGEFRHLAAPWSLTLTMPVTTTAGRRGYRAAGGVSLMVAA